MGADLGGGHGPRSASRTGDSPRWRSRKPRYSDGRCGHRPPASGATAAARGPDAPARPAGPLRRSSAENGPSFGRAFDHPGDEGHQFAAHGRGVKPSSSGEPKAQMAWRAPEADRPTGRRRTAGPCGSGRRTSPRPRPRRTGSGRRNSDPARSGRGRPAGRRRRRPRARASRTARRRASPVRWPRRRGRNAPGPPRRDGGRGRSGCGLPSGPAPRRGSGSGRRNWRGRPPRCVLRASASRVGGLFQLRQGGAAELHDIAAVRLQPDLFQQGAVVQKDLRIGLQPGPDVRPMRPGLFQLGERSGETLTDLSSETPGRMLQDRLTGLAPVRQEGIKTLVG
jgi:hypothetical protein